jgi:hypothetical protein
MDDPVSISSATRINYAVRKGNSAPAIGIAGCGSMPLGNLNTLLAGGVPANYTVNTVGACTASDGGTATSADTNSNVSPAQIANAVIVCVN